MSRLGGDHFLRPGRLSHSFLGQKEKGRAWQNGIQISASVYFSQKKIFLTNFKSTQYHGFRKIYIVLAIIFCKIQRIAKKD